MGNTACLRIIGKIKPALSKQLLSFQKEWSFESNSAPIPEHPVMLEVFEYLEKLLADMSTAALKTNVLDVEVEFESDGEDIVILKEFLEVALEELTEGWYHDADGEHITYEFDAKKKKLAEVEDGFADGCALCRRIDFDEVEDAAPTVKQTRPSAKLVQWRKKLHYLLGIMADLDRQKKIFSHSGRDSLSPADKLIECWLDLSDLYLEVLELERGVAYTEKAGFLTTEEAKVLKPFHQKFKNYFPKDYDDDAVTLRDPKWKEVTELAKSTHQSMLKLFERRGDGSSQS